MSGRLELRFDKKPVASGMYENEFERNRLIKRWKKLYGKGYQKAIVLDIANPDIVKKVKDGYYEK